MYAFVASGIQTVVRTPGQLESLIAVYPYPKFAKVANEDEARAWIRAHQRIDYGYNIDNYGDTANYGYVDAEYKILTDSVKYHISTDKLGYIRVESSEVVLVDSRQDSLNIVVKGLKLNNDLIAHHVIAIQRLLNIMGEYVDVNVHVPDMSIYLALTKYTGKHPIITSTQKFVKARLGGFAITVKQIGGDCSNVEVHESS